VNEGWGKRSVCHARSLSRTVFPVEMCEVSELSELSPQDAVESLSVKGVMGGVGLFFEETQGFGRPISSGCSLFNYL
jgi:hypothetical protein